MHRVHMQQVSVHGLSMLIESQMLSRQAAHVIMTMATQQAAQHHDFLHQCQHEVYMLIMHMALAAFKASKAC